jgi:4-amino-4-deoxy-L-arabinose transferase-like glycosyltransferase
VSELLIIICTYRLISTKIMDKVMTAIQMRPDRKWKKVIYLAAATIICLLVSGPLFGWPSLVLVWKSEGMYAHLCNDNPEGLKTSIINGANSQFHEKKQKKKQTNKKTQRRLLASLNTHWLTLIICYYLYC